MTEINHTNPADRIATAQDYAALSFGPATDRPFDQKAWREKAAEFVALERFVIAVMRMDDKELSAKVAKSEESADSFLEMYDTFETLRQYYKDGIEVVESARVRIMVALSRLELRFGGGCVMNHIKPYMVQFSKERNYERLDIPTLEFAGRCNEWLHNYNTDAVSECTRYEFIGSYDALMALGCVEAQMLDVGKSGKKNREFFNTQKLTNNRFRLELIHADPAEIGAALKAANIIGRTTFPTFVRHDPVSTALAKASALIERYPTNLHSRLYRGLCDSAGNGWQLIESFPWLAVRVFVLDDDTAARGRGFVRRGAKLREIAEAAKMAMCFKRFAPKATDHFMALSDLLSRHTDIVSRHCPEREKQQVSWLSFIAKASESGDEDFAIWMAVHWSELSKRPYLAGTRQAAGILADWIKACVVEQSISGIEAAHIEGICQAMLIAGHTEAADNLQEWWQSVTGAVEAGRPFNKEMPPQTVLRLSGKWHKRVTGDKAAVRTWFDGPKLKLLTAEGA